MFQLTCAPNVIEFKGAKNPHVLEDLAWSCGRLWMFLTGVLVPDHDGEALPHTSRFRRYLNIPKRTPNGRVINYGPCDIKRDRQTFEHYYFVYIDALSS